MHGEDTNRHFINLRAKKKTSWKDAIDRSNVNISLADYLGEAAHSKIQRKGEVKRKYTLKWDEWKKERQVLSGRVVSEMTSYLISK